ncbi:MAG TPA: hypothetical protein VHT73_05545 [Thermodesulfobacteriota bacterium]|nr:hypothetical protein [Thermodesulfobacteriota bacterium]
MTMIKRTIWIAILFFGIATIFVFAQEWKEHGGTKPIDHMSSVKEVPLTEPGNAVFAAIQEAIGQLEADPNTDWSKIDLEALRRHLVDMHNFMVNVEVLEQKPVEKGIHIEVRPVSALAGATLDRVLSSSAHPAVLKHEAGWDMRVSKQGNIYIIVVTTDNSQEVDKIRGLGYGGIMAYGKHHLSHHWKIVSDKDPHLKH